MLKYDDFVSSLLSGHWNLFIFIHDLFISLSLFMITLSLYLYHKGHWDLALLVSALNFYAIDGSGRKVIPSKR